MILAAIDLGTNTIRFIVAEVLNGQCLRILWRDREVVRIGRGLARERRVLPDSLERAARVTERFSAQARKLGAENIRLIGTSALREAENTKDVQQLISRRTGLVLQTISGQAEAQLASYGAIKTLGLPQENLAVVDVGGGSSELAYFPSGGPSSFFSISIGVVGLTEKFLLHNPPDRDEYEQMYQFCHSSIEKSISSLLPCPQMNFIGTGGTATTLAAIQQGLITYDPEKISNYILSRPTLEKLESCLSSMTLSERRQVPGLEKGREDIILAGMAVFLTFMRILTVSQIVVSDAGLLEGIIFHEINPLPSVQRFS